MIRVSDINESLKFYRGLLGLKLIRQMELEDSTLYFLNDGVSDAEIELTYNHEVPKEGYNNGNSLGHLAFGVDDMDKFTSKMQSSGYEYLYEPFILPGHKVKIAFLKDPDGREIEIIEK
jgi:lactoylglutathione lyase